MYQALFEALRSSSVLNVQRKILSSWGLCADGKRQRVNQANSKTRPLAVARAEEESEAGEAAWEVVTLTRVVLGSRSSLGVDP